MEVKGSCDLPVLQREHLGQLGDDDPFGAPVVTGVAGDEMAVDEDGAVIVGGGNDLQAGRHVRKERRSWACSLIPEYEPRDGPLRHNFNPVRIENEKPSHV